MSDDLRRVLVTGSRSWTDAQQIADALLETRRETVQDGGGGILVVHGAGTSGAAAIAADWCAANDVPAEHHAADPDFDGKDADHIHDQRMVSLGADLCLVFVGPCTSGKCRRPKPHSSHDAYACATLAENAGIPVRKWTEAAAA
jgi:hypothetical protein